MKAIAKGHSRPAATATSHQLEIGGERLPIVTQVFLHAFGRRLGIAAAPAHNRSRKPVETKRHLRDLCHRHNTIQHQRAIDYERAFASKQQHGESACGNDDICSPCHQRTDLFDEIRAKLRVTRFVGEGAHEVGQVYMNGPHPGYTLTETVCCYLPLMPIDKDGIYGHKTDPVAHAHCSEKACLAQPDDGDIDRATDF
jgi:hypothetical protein